MKTVLYINSSGKDVTHSSYSSRQTYRHCPREFQHTRIEGWSDKAQRAAPLFGRCIESGVQAYEEGGRSSDAGVKVFRRLWEEVKLMPEFKELVYTTTEGSWEQLLKSGTEMQKLYEVKAPYLPIVKPVFQQKIRKTIFPGTNLAMLENVAILDMLSFPAWNHKLLPKISVDVECHNCAVRWSCSLEADGPVFVPCDEHRRRELIIDVKTSGKDFPTDLVALDPQLAEYAWQTRIPDVAFLWFVKAGHGFKKGSRITLLQANQALWAGWEGLVIDITEPFGPATEDGKFTAQEEDKPVGLYIGDYAALTKYEAAIKGLRGKARDAAEKKALDEGLGDGTIIAANDTHVTKQRLQFAAARLSEQEMDDVGRSVAQSTVEMVRAHEENFYPKMPGVRFPNERCGFCSMRWLCLHRPEERDKNLTRRGEEWLDDIQDEGNE